jgi:hypothetical protein
VISRRLFPKSKFLSLVKGQELRHPHLCPLPSRKGCFKVTLGESCNGVITPTVRASDTLLYHWPDRKNVGLGVISTCRLVSL